MRKSNDNAHIERFNRTIQEECLSPNIRASIVPERIYIGISHTATSSGGAQALMEIIRLIYWIGIAANKCVAKVVSLVRRNSLLRHSGRNSRHLNTITYSQKFLHLTCHPILLHHQICHTINSLYIISSFLILLTYFTREECLQTV